MSHNVSPLESVSGQEDQPDVSIRCIYINARGHRCTTPLPDNTSEFCLHHARLRQRREMAQAKELSDELLGDELFGCRLDFAELFLRLFDAIASKRLSRRDGSVLAYTASRAMQCFPPVRAERNSYSEDGLPLDQYGVPIPPPVHYEQDSKTGEWREIPPEEESAQQTSSSTEPSWWTK